MLPVLIYETDTALRAMLLQTLKALPGAAMLKIISASASADDTERFFAAQEGITLTVIGGVSSFVFGLIVAPSGLHNVTIIVTIFGMPNSRAIFVKPEAIH